MRSPRSLKAGQLQHRTHPINTFPKTRADQIARQIRILGQVQGVGFRPYVFRLAQRLGVSGWVLNQGGMVEIYLEGESGAIKAFLAILPEECPASAQIQKLEINDARVLGFKGFTILQSRDTKRDVRVLPPDQAVCQDCLEEISDPQNLRYRYPFTHCTQCGPRYTLSRGFPLDREQTAMKVFRPCSRCLMEYEDPSNRRYHAQNICCPECGPKLHFRLSAQTKTAHVDPVMAAVAEIRRGGVIAVKGMGGYHLMCDAAKDAAVRTLRKRKHRPARPLAVMMHRQAFDSLPMPWSSQIASTLRPIVLIPKHLVSNLSEEIAPGLSEVGCMLPDSPLHHLLSEGFQGPLVVTSANVSGEPILIENAETEEVLRDVADGFLHHDRPIDRPADDAVFRYVGGRFRPLRLGRGVAPRIMPLRRSLPQCLVAFGGDLKNTVALAHENQVVISPHLGDISSSRSLELVRKAVRELSDLLGLAPEGVICDAHPDYRSALLAETWELPLIKVPHHYAHASALYEEAGQQQPILVFTFDGLGYGPDGTLWGGEALWGQPGSWHRVAGLRRLKLPGGDKASREPWRMGVALAFECGLSWHAAPAGAEAVFGLLEAGVKIPETSSMGRLFDAAAALTGIAHLQTYEGQAAMMLEAISRGGAEPVPLPLVEVEGILRWDFRSLTQVLLDSKKSPGERGSIFHATIAQAVVALAQQYQESHGIRAIGLTGGVFQNHLLTTEIQQRIRGSGLEVLIPELIPLNDAGLCFGQVVEAQSMQREKIED